MKLSQHLTSDWLWHQMKKHAIKDSFRPVEIRDKQQRKEPVIPATLGIKEEDLELKVSRSYREIQDQPGRFVETLPPNQKEAVGWGITQWQSAC